MSHSGVAHETLEPSRCVLTFHFHGAGSLVLLAGAATVFCAPLRLNVRYQFEKMGIPVEVLTTARLDVQGEYTVAARPLQSTVQDIHAILDAVRAEALLNIHRRTTAAGTRPGSGAEEEDTHYGPRVMIIGDQNTGKSSLCNALVNLATRERRCAVALIDVDVGQQSITCPGTVAAAFMESPVPLDDGFNSVMPLSFFFGDKIVTTTTRKRYLDLCAYAAQAVASVAASQPAFEAGGLIVNTMGWITELGKDLLIELLSIFSVTHIIVTGSNVELETTMQNAAIGRSVRIIRYPTQPAILCRKGTLLAAARTQHVVQYFVGTPRAPFCPARGVAKVQDVVFLNALTLARMDWKDIRPNSVAAVSWANTEETAGEANVAGFVVLLEVGKRFFSFLSPAPGDLPKPFLLVSPTITLPHSKIPPLNP